MYVHNHIVLTLSRRRSGYETTNAMEDFLPKIVKLIPFSCQETSAGSNLRYLGENEFNWTFHTAYFRSLTKHCSNRESKCNIISGFQVVK